MQTQIKWTLEDYHRMIDAGILTDRKVELLDGEIIAMAPEGSPHKYYGGRLSDRLRRDIGERALVIEGGPITLSDSEPQPDIAIVKGGWSDYFYRHPYAEDILLIIEISNTTLAKDLGQKRLTYASVGIEDYWVLDLKNHQIVVFRQLQDGDYQSEQRLREGTLTPVAFPELSFSVNQLLAYPPKR